VARHPSSSGSARPVTSAFPSAPPTSPTAADRSRRPSATVLRNPPA